MGNSISKISIHTHILEFTTMDRTFQKQNKNIVSKCINSYISGFYFMDTFVLEMILIPYLFPKNYEETKNVFTSFIHMEIL